MTRDVKVDDIYTGKVSRVLNFGAMVEILPGKEGLVHISQLADYRVAQVEDEVKVGDEITVKVVEIDSLGRINLSRRALFENVEKVTSPRPVRARDSFSQERRAGRQSDRGGARPQDRRGRRSSYSSR